MNVIPATKALPQRRWFQLRLRTLLVLVTLASVPLSWVGWELDQRRREKQAIAWVEEMGGTVILKNPNILSLAGTKVRDLSPLAELKKLECLSFDRAPVSDLSPLCLLYTSPSPRDLSTSRMPSSA